MTVDHWENQLQSADARQYGQGGTYKGGGMLRVCNASVNTVAEMLSKLDREDRGFTFLGSTDPVLVTFAEIEAVTADLARRWAGLGVQQGDRVVLIVGDEREFILTFLSALRAGVVAVPMFPPFMRGRLDAYYITLRRICELSSAARCLVSQPLVDLLGHAGLECPVSVFEDLVTATPGVVGSPAPDDLAFLQFSSGSTGNPKGAAVTHRALLANSYAIGRHGLRADGEVDRAVSWLPLYHDMGLVGFLIGPLLEQVATWYLPPLRFARDPVSWPRLMSEVGATLTFAPNFAYGLVTRRVTDEVLAKLDLSRWRVAGCGAEPVRADTLRAFADRFASAGFRASSLMPSYGLAEATLAVALTPCDAGITTLTVDADLLAAKSRVAPIDVDAENARTIELVSCGPPVHGTEVRVLAPAGSVCAEGQEGELVVRGESLAGGYFGDPECSAQIWRDGWLHTGDTGFLYEGQLYVTGRIKDLIVVNGRNHQPQDIEWVASQVPGVRVGNVVALPVPGNDTEGVRVVLEAFQGAMAEDLAQQVRQAVNRRLGLPVHHVVVLPRGGLPKTRSGKLRRSHTASLLDDGLLVGRG
jgi:fatty-acyl-CoA synthase